MGKLFFKVLSISICVFFISTLFATSVSATTSRVSTPTFFPSNGTYYSSQQVTILCNTFGATIRYTTNGDEPTSLSTKYSIAIPISTTTTIKAKAFKSGMTDSITAWATYTIKPPNSVTTPTFFPSSGTYTGSQQVFISCSTGGVTIRYTTNGDEPSSSSTKYSIAIPISTTTTIKAKAFRIGLTDSATASATYTIQPLSLIDTPTFSPSSGNYTGSQQVTISCSTNGTTIRYTTNGDEPSSSSTKYSSSITISTATTIKAKAFKSGMLDSATASATYNILVNLIITKNNLSTLNNLGPQAYEIVTPANSYYQKLLWVYGKILDVINPKNNLVSSGKYTQTADGAGGYFGESVSFVKFMTHRIDVSTSQWVKGDQVISGAISPGVAIATFPNGYSGHSAIFKDYLRDGKGQILRDDKGMAIGFFVWDQNWDKTGVVGTHIIYAYKGSTTVEVNGENYFVIKVPAL
jgi:hypothetical protein